MTSMETEYLKGLDGTYSQNREQGYRGDKKNWGGGGVKVSIRTMHCVNTPHSSTPLPFLHKGGCSTFPKLMEMGVGDLKIFAEKTITHGQFWTIIGGGRGWGEAASLIRC